MKRTLLIVGGIVTVLILIAIWMYILFTGTTSEDISFNDFGFGDSTDPTIIITEEELVETDDTQTSDKPDRLRQLTTQPVAGFSQTVIARDGEPVVTYVESGTGHIYNINLATEESVRVSATTIPLTQVAAVTPNGQHVIIQSDIGARASFTFGTISSTTDRLSNYELVEQITTFTATDDNQFLLATRGSGSLIVKKLDPITSDIETLFTVPFQEAAVSWHHTVDGPHFVYPKATSQLEGYVYKYLNGQVERVNATGYGLSAAGSDAVTLFSSIEEEAYTSYTLDKEALVPAATPLVFVPEKCQFTSNSETIVLCGATFNDLPYQMPDRWYRGEVTTNDNLWEYNTLSQSARLLVSPETATGRQIDLINPNISTDDHNLFFQNKLDQTLWVYQYIILNN